MITFAAGDEGAIREASAAEQVPFRAVGTVRGTRLSIRVSGGRLLVDEDVASLQEIWTTSFESAIAAADVL